MEIKYGYNVVRRESEYRFSDTMDILHKDRLTRFS